MELGPQHHNGDGLLGPNSTILGVYSPSGFDFNKGAQTEKGQTGNTEEPKYMRRGFLKTEDEGF